MGGRASVPVYSPFRSGICRGFGEDGAPAPPAAGPRRRSRRLDGEKRILTGAAREPGMMVVMDHSCGLADRVAADDGST